MTSEITGPAHTDTQKQTRDVVLSLGSNQGDRLAWLNRACAALAALPETRLVARSPIYETEPVDVPARFATHLFLNLVAIVETDLGPRVFLDAIHAIETDLHRVRNGVPNTPRTLDIDIVAFGDLVVASPELTLPHPRAHTRRFVLQPLADLRPDYRLPGEPRTVSDLLKGLPTTPSAVRLPAAQ